MLVRTYLSNSFSILVKVFAGIFLLKICVEYLGKDGFGKVSQFQSLVLMIYAFLNALLFNHTAQINWTKNKKELLSTLLGISTILSFIFAFFLLMFSREISLKLLGDNEGVTAIHILAWSSPLIGFFIVYSAKLCAEGRLVLFNILNAIAIILSSFFIYILAFFYGLKGVYIGFAMYYIFPMILFTISVMSREWNLNTLMPSFDRIKKYPYQNMSKLGFIGIFSACNAIALQIFLRHKLSSVSGWGAVADWQVITKLSESYMLLVTTPLTTYLLPSLAKLEKIDAQHLLIKKILKYGITITILTGIFLYFSWNIFVVKLVGLTFYSLQSLALMQLIGDVFKIITWTFMIVATARLQIKTIIKAELIYSFFYIGFNLILLPKYNTEGAILAYIYAYLMTSIFLIYSYYKIKNCPQKI